MKIRSGTRQFITIREEDITNGKRKNTLLCPLALAFKRVFPKNIITVHKATIKVIDPSTKRAKYEYFREIKLDEVAREFIKRFDHGKRVKPFNFELIWYD